MMKIKPNDPCGCGSGKKAKKCCGSKSKGKGKAKPSEPETPQLIGTWGLPGIELLLNVTPFNSKKPKKLNPGGKKGKYKASFLLGKPNYAPLDENQVSFDIDKNKGNSHIFIGDPENLRVEITANLPDGNYFFFGYANAEGYLSKIEIEEFEALNFQDAMDKAYNALCPILSHISILNNVPLYIYNFTVVELLTNNHLSSLTLPYLNQHGPILDNFPKNKDFEKFASLYREGLNNNSPNYQYLCFYKVIEGIRKLKEERTRKENQKILLTGKTPFRKRETLPADMSGQQAWLSSLFGKQRWSDLAIAQVFSHGVAGRKINDLINPGKELDMVRNKIAHAVLRDELEVTFSIDDGKDIRTVHTWLPLCKCLALYLMKQEYPQAFGIA